MVKLNLIYCWDTLGNDDFGHCHIFVLFVTDGNILEKFSVNLSLILLNVMNIHRASSSVKVWSQRQHESEKQREYLSHVLDVLPKPFKVLLLACLHQILSHFDFHPAAAGTERTRNCLSFTLYSSLFCSDLLLCHQKVTLESWRLNQAIAQETRWFGAEFNDTATFEKPSRLRGHSKHSVFEAVARCGEMSQSFEAWLSQVFKGWFSEWNDDVIIMTHKLVG